ncbi:MAG TPA: SRPBCC domain-containing protein [Gemmatimonadales bacterium]|nr:SRPBCC domain-containing protein [Gemmatimonadales bacterium]
MKQTRRHTVRILVLAVLYGPFAWQAAAPAQSNGFSVKHEAVINAPPAGVYRALVQQVGEWWNPQHTYSGDSKNLSIDARPGGCFCETLPAGGGVEHLRVVYLVPGEMLRLSGGLGPLQASGVVGTLSWKLTDTGSATTVEVTYVVGGFMEGGFERIVPAVNRVIGEQLRRLKLFIETGKPTQDTGQP